MAKPSLDSSLGATERLLVLKASKPFSRHILSVAMGGFFKYLRPRMVELRIGSKLLLLGGFIVFLFISCNKEEKKDFQNDLFDDYLNLNFNSYSKIHKQINDSLQKWVQDSLTVTESFFYHPYKVDSVLCFNSDSTRLFTTINKRIGEFKDAVQDNITELGGAFIQGRWYFVLMGSNVIDRGSYQDSVYAPLTFEELSYIAHKEIFPMPNKDSVTGKMYFNLDNLFYHSDCEGRPNQRQCQDEKIVEQNQWRPWKNEGRYLDKEEVEKIKQEMAASVRPPEPVKTKTLWEMWFDKKEEKIFESEAWKNRKR